MEYTKENVIFHENNSTEKYSREVRDEMKAVGENKKRRGNVLPYLNRISACLKQNIPVV